MLRELIIKNFAIIDDMKVRFKSGLTILSGETGAGKSIIINAVNLVLGSRASAKMIRDGYETAELSAFFDVPSASKAAKRMTESGFSPEDGLMVRRVISSSDRHRVYVNDQRVTIQTLAAITFDLASISGQHAHQGLLKEESHLDALDLFGGLLPLVEKVSELYAKLTPLVQSLSSLETKKRNREKEMDLLRYQTAEIVDAGIQPCEDETLEKERIRLKHAQTLHQTVYGVIESLYGADGAILDRLGVLRKEMEKAASLDSALAAIPETLSNSFFELEEVVGSLRGYLGGLDTGSDQLEFVEARLDLINRLKRKYGGSLESLFAQHDAMNAKLLAIDKLDEEIETITEELKETHSQFAQLSRVLSEKRKKVAETFATSVEKELHSLKMTGTRFAVELSQPSASGTTSPWLCMDDCPMSAKGIDRASFRISPNVGESLKALSAIASGGELSRVVLALKAILAGNDMVSTIIFDEVDAGIGGAVADVVGKKLKVLSKKHQLICITHLPQIARFGSNHYFIRKQVQKGRTTTTIRPMNQEQRIAEIARMLGGEEITQTALDHARSLIVQ